MNDISMSVNTSGNRHPVDALADVREQIKSLKEKEESLKTLVSQKMGTRGNLGGDEFIARQTMSERAGSIDIKAMEKDGIDAEKYRKPKTVVVSIRVERRAAEAE